MTSSSSLRSRWRERSVRSEARSRSSSCTPTPPLTPFIIRGLLLLLLLLLLSPVPRCAARVQLSVQRYLFCCSAA